MIVRRARRLSPTANGSFDKSSAIKATSAASSATSVPVAPIAIPTVAVASAGASFTPSPTIATDPQVCINALTSTILFSGSNSAFTSSIPSGLAITLATVALSPVSMISLRMPSDFSLAKIRATSGRT